MRERAAYAEQRRFYELGTCGYLLREISAPIEKYRTFDETAENADYNKTLKHAAGCSRHVSNMTIIGDPTRDPPALPCMHRPCLAVRRAYMSRTRASVPLPKPIWQACSPYQRITLAAQGYISYLSFDRNSLMRFQNLYRIYRWSQPVRQTLFHSNNSESSGCARESCGSTRRAARCVL